MDTDYLQHDWQLLTYHCDRDQVSINTGFTLSLDIGFHFSQPPSSSTSADHLTFYKTRSDLPVHQHPKHAKPL